MRMKLPILALLSIAVAGRSFPAFAQVDDVAVVVNYNNQASALSEAELKKIFLGERRSWAVGPPIRLVVLPMDTAESSALLKLVGMSGREFKQYWLALVFRGKVEAEPTNVPSIGMQIEALSALPGAITLVRAKDVKPGMKMLKIDGHLPGEPGYPLHYQ